MVRSIQKRITWKKPAMIGAMLLMAAFGLAACGDNTASSANTQPAAATSNPASGTTAANSAGTANNANPNPGQGQAAPGAGGLNRGNFSPPLAGTVQSYDATTKILTVKAADGSSQQFELSQSRISKTSNITTDELKQLITATSRLQITGQQNTDGSYNATNLTVLDQTALPGTGNGGRGGPGAAAGAGQNQGQAGSAPGANGAAGQGQGRPNAGQGQAGQNGANPFLMLQNPTLSGNQLTGTGFNGEAITVNLSSSTTMTKRAAGTVDDLKAGSTVSVMYQAAQGSNPASAFTVTIS